MKRVLWEVERFPIDRVPVMLLQLFSTSILFLRWNYKRPHNLLCLLHHDPFFLKRKDLNVIEKTVWVAKIKISHFPLPLCITFLSHSFPFFFGFSVCSLYIYILINFYFISFSLLISFSLFPFLVCILSFFIH